MNHADSGGLADTRILFDFIIAKLLEIEITLTTKALVVVWLRHHGIHRGRCRRVVSQWLGRIFLVASV